MTPERTTLWKALLRARTIEQVTYRVYLQSLAEGRPQAIQAARDAARKARADRSLAEANLALAQTED